jgi:ATP-dependent helicase/nuclease subunit B
LGAHGLFNGPAPRVFTIPAPLSFLDELAASLIAATADDASPFALADAVILLPTRRAARGLMDAFARKLGGAALLPTMRPLADLEDDPDVWGPEPVAFAVPPAIAPMRRRMELAALIRARAAAEGGVDEPVRALAFADELCALLDGAAAAGEVDWSKLPELVDDEHLAAHWRASAQFLDIIASYWPQRLSADGLSDPGERRSAILRALAVQWSNAPPNGPVIIAGSTGSLPATRALMAVVMGLPKGAVVLPGLDRDLDNRAWDAIGPQHPQASLKETLGALGLQRTDIQELACVAHDEGKARAVLLREALAPADATADWLLRIAAAGGAPLIGLGAQGLSLIEAETETEEAAVIALALRAAIEPQGRTAALVTPSAALARRVASKLSRFGVIAALSVGRPMSDTPVGSLLLALLALAEDSGDPIALLELMKHPDVSSPDEKAIAEFEHARLRGARRYADFAALMQTPEGARCLEPLGASLAPLIALRTAETLGLDELAITVTSCAEALGSEALWSGADGAAAAGLLRDVCETGEALGPMRPSQAYRALNRLITRAEVMPESPGESRIAIYGPLEARLQRRDFLVLGGLNEGVWPETPSEGAFLSRRMRTMLGLPSPDQRVGLAAHDFAQLACSPNVLLTRAKREGGAPAVASRWIWRLQTLLRGAGGTDLLDADEPLQDWAAALDRPEALRPCSAPTPRLRRPEILSRLSVTDAETLFRDPYAFFAKRLLGLNALRQVGQEAAAAERGTAIHAAIEAFENLPLADRSQERLALLLEIELVSAGFRPGQIAADKARLAVAAHVYSKWSRDQVQAGAQTAIERRGRLTMPRTGILLSGKADRIDHYTDGSAQIVDVKTGAPPTVDQMKKDFSPQLLLETAMLAAGVFEDVPAARVKRLIYWRFAGARAVPQEVDIPPAMLPDAAAQALEALEGLVAGYRAGIEPFRSKPRAFFAKAWGDYDHLARRKEWASEGDE